MRSADPILGVALAALGALCLFESFRLKGGWQGAGTMPLIVGTILLITSFVLLLSTSHASTPIQWPSRKEIRGMGVIGGSFGLYIYVIDWLGYALGTWLFLAIVARYISPSRLSVILIWTGAVAIGTYIIFKKYLFMYLPEGFIGI